MNARISLILLPQIAVDTRGCAMRLRNAFGALRRQFGLPGFSLTTQTTARSEFNLPRPGQPAVRVCVYPVKSCLILSADRPWNGGRAVSSFLPCLGMRLRRAVQTYGRRLKTGLQRDVGGPDALESTTHDHTGTTLARN